MTKTFNKPIAGLSISLGFLTGCFNTPELERYYIQIAETKLAIDNKYVKTTLAFETSGNKELIRKQASAPPGLEVDSFNFTVEYFDLEPINRFDPLANRKSIPDTIEIILSDPNEKSSRYFSPELNEERIVEGMRDSDSDKFELESYSGIDIGFNSTGYLPHSNEGRKLSIVCSSLSHINPICTAFSKWNGINLRYKFRYIHLQDWRGIDNRAIGLLNSFSK